jgi:3-hydroxyisobutyrate dehydrogenase-like beta-hydroxyacid dehydrogenase
MGLGMARLLKAHDYRVVTVTEGRRYRKRREQRGKKKANSTSEHTLARINSAGIETLPSDDDLVIEADYILSIVPPKNAAATAQRIATAYAYTSRESQTDQTNREGSRPKRTDLYYLELNAVPARMAAEMASLFFDAREIPDNANRLEKPDNLDQSGKCGQCHFLDGGIIGGPPQSTQDGAWTKPSVVLSGAVDIDLAPAFEALAEVLNLRLVSTQIGAAKTLKLSFSALTKGLTALSIMSFSTAQTASMLPQLLALLEEHSPRTAALATHGVIGMSPKAYRWEDEMRGIGETLESVGGWDVGGSVYGGIAEVYRTIAEDTVLGQERVGHRVHGVTVDDAARIIASRDTRMS